MRTLLVQRKENIQCYLRRVRPGYASPQFSWNNRQGAELLCNRCVMPKSFAIQLFYGNDWNCRLRWRSATKPLYAIRLHSMVWFNVYYGEGRGGRTLTIKKAKDLLSNWVPGLFTSFRFIFIISWKGWPLFSFIGCCWVHAYCNKQATKDFRFSKKYAHDFFFIPKNIAYCARSIEEHSFGQKSSAPLHHPAPSPCFLHTFSTSILYFHFPYFFFIQVHNLMYLKQ